MTNNYIVAVDENGQPFIAHARKGLKPHFSTNYLYFRKVKLPNGKTRYFYTEKAYQAWLKNQQPAKDKEKQKEKAAKIMKLQKRYKIVAEKRGTDSEAAKKILKELRALYG